MEQIKEKYERFKEWQIKPYEVAQLTAEKHECATCHTEFHGNYCPRCGQKSTIGRYSFKTAFLTFLDVWGLGNRGMFRTIRDLLLRPGYMIRDYLNGMQMAYFPPFKMFFLVITLSVLVDSGLNIRMTNTLNNTFTTTTKEDVSKEPDQALNDNDSKKKLELKILDKIDKCVSWLDNNQTIVQFLLLLVLSGPMYLLFRKNKKISDIRYSELFIAMVYITNMMTIINIIGGFFLPGNASVKHLAYALSIIPLTQLFGYSYLKTLFKVVASFAILISAGALLLIIVVILGYLFIEYIL
ncbi:MAG: DUF3667 domain-containing protein [Prevotella ruminicola]|jgi:hypothetical protein|uniref:DUF3667 domain-containing protein n=1 Tax=Xylanibacter ruminicola TaxID=839 RepID=A0A928GIJ7_XYLRU|nr:DUF3667 domain-containing protein [Xylanibacter ruminicola]